MASATPDAVTGIIFIDNGLDLTPKR